MKNSNEVKSVNNLYEFNTILSKESFCLSETYITKLINDKKQQIYHGLMYDNSSKPMIREFFYVKVNGEFYWASKNTGVLFNKNGLCKTSSILKLKEPPITFENTRKYATAA